MLTPALTKDPGETLDYNIDWTQFLAGDTISTSTWSIPTGITKNSDTHTTTTTTAWMTGGTNGQAYQLVNSITTAGGRTAERTMEIAVITK